MFEYGIAPPTRAQLTQNMNEINERSITQKSNQSLPKSQIASCQVSFVYKKKVFVNIYVYT